ncbi:Interferon regulatory factor 2 [Holothuria leucospilota]|uniref:Interferon regulatory factor 2 n=1 Tax=Holothuria leucospilota TaxID=206669 RepID=A0A9Q0YHS9_HOLLE|nr:Interferon regulatory factor 2 [Holothuria leucospilota]
MPGLVLPSPSHLSNFGQAMYHTHQGMSYTTAHLPTVPSGYNPNSTHQYPRQPSQPPQETQSKPLRPAERMRLRPWLIKMIEERKIAGLEWEDKERQIVRIPWKHAARHGWIKDRDASLFKAWAIHTKKYNPDTDTPKANPKMWKANFRCAINSLPDIEELRDRGKTKGNDAYKVYRLIPKTKAAKPKSDPAKSKKSRNSKPKALRAAKQTTDTKPNALLSSRQSEIPAPQRMDYIASQRLDSKLSISTKVENQFQSPLSSPTSVASSQPSTPLSAPPVSFPKQWSDPYPSWLQPTTFQQYTPEADEYMSDASGSNMTDEEIVDMVDEMIKESPTHSPNHTVPSSPLDFDGNNNNVLWENEVQRTLSQAFGQPLPSPISPTVTPTNCHTYYNPEYHHVGIVKVEPQSEDCLSPSSYPREPPPNYYDAVAARAECIKEESSPTYCKL